VAIAITQLSPVDVRSLSLGMRRADREGKIYFETERTKTWRKAFATITKDTDALVDRYLAGLGYVVPPDQLWIQNSRQSATSKARRPERNRIAAAITHSENQMRLPWIESASDCLQTNSLNIETTLDEDAVVVKGRLEGNKKIVVHARPCARARRGDQVQIRAPSTALAPWASRPSFRASVPPLLPLDLTNGLIRINSLDASNYCAVIYAREQALVHSINRYG
jgi:hypothetical protein